MKSIRTAFLICLFSSLLIATTYGQWVQTNGPYGGEINCLEKIGANIFAGTPYGGVYLSTNNGASWSAASTGLTSLSIYSLAASGTNLFAGTGSGVFLSTNNGTSWAAVNSGLTGSSVLAITSKDANLFAGVWTHGVFLSTNNGASWTTVNNGLTNFYVRALAVFGTSLFLGTDDGAFLSTDNGTTWVPETTGMPADSYVDAFASIDTNLFAGVWGPGAVYRWTNSDSSWIAVNSGLTSTSTYALAASGTTLYAGMTNGGGVFRSTNYGANWSPAITGLTNHSAISLLVGGTNLFVGTRAGVFVSTNAGTNWSSASSGLLSTDIQGFAVSGTNLFAAAGHGGIFLSTDDGSVWTPVSNGLEDLSTSELAASGSNLFAATNSGVYRSTNNGTTWTPVGGGGSWYVLLASGSNLFRGTSSGVQLSTDNGDSWTWINNGLTNTNVQALSVKDTRLFAGTYGGGAFVSTDNGANWVAANSGLTNLYVLAFGVSDTNLLAGTGGGGIYLSTDNGASWTMASTGLTSPSISAFAVSGTNILAGTGGGGVFLSTNSGTSWAPVNPGLTNLKVQTLGFSGARLFAGLYAGGVWSANLQSLIPPGPPAGLIVTDSSSVTITIKWRKNTEPDFLRYRIYRSTTPSPTTKVDSTTAGAADTAKTFTGLVNGTRYYFRVTAVDSTGNESAYSNEVNAVPADRLAPAAPSSLVITDSSSTTITIKWRKHSAPDFLRYRIYRGTSPSPTTKADSTTAGAADTSKTFAGLTNGTRYYLRITAVDSAGNESAYSNEVNAVPADRLAPTAPAGLIVTDSSSTTITVKWRKHSAPDFLRYRIYRNTTPNPTTKVDSTTGGAADTSKTFAGLTNGTRYYLRITAVDSAGNESAYSNEVNAAPNVPSGIDDLLSQIPTEFSLAQNYPNPFNPNTVIRYGLPVRSHVRLEIFNMLGQRVALLADEEQDAHYYEKTWQADGASGLYFYRLEAVSSDDANRRYVEVRKMILVK